MSSVVSQAMDNIANRAGAVTAVSGRVRQGHYREGEATAFENNVRALSAESQGYFYFWIGRRETGLQPQRDFGKLTVKARLQYRLPTDTSSTMDTVTDVCESILSALMQESVWTSLAIVPLQSSYSPAEDGLEDGIGSFEFELNFQLPPIC